MPLMNWMDNYSIDIEELDNDHKKLVEVMNELYSAIHEGKANEIVEDIIIKLIHYTRSHFSEEENYMLESGYNDYLSHKEEHEKFLSRIEKYQMAFLNGEPMLSNLISAFLNDWFLHHVLVADKKIASRNAVLK